MLYAVDLIKESRYWGWDICRTLMHDNDSLEDLTPPPPPCMNQNIPKHKKTLFSFPSGSKQTKQTKENKNRCIDTKNKWVVATGEGDGVGQNR